MAKSYDITIPYSPRPHQREIHKNLKRFNVLVCHRRFGKALALDTPVPMYDGSWTTMGALQAGDRIIGSDGEFTTVLYAHEVLYNRDCYQLEFTSGDKIIADAEHLWLTIQKKDRHNPVRQPDGSRINCPRPPQARTTKEIAETLRSRGEFNHRIPLVEPVNFSANQHLPLDPYLLGRWLGDGTLRSSESIKNDWVLKKIKYQNSGQAISYRINKELHLQLKHLGLLKNKHIPDIFLKASLDDRISLLQGLMDTDGCINKAGNYCEFTQKNKNIINGVERLLLSLGMVAHISIRVIKGCDYYTIGFRPIVQVFRLQRNATLYVETPECNRWQSIVKCEPVESVPVRCITVDAPDKLFCVGHKYILTHNTVTAINQLIKSCMLCPKQRPRFAYIAPLYKQAKAVAWDYLCYYSAPIPKIQVNQSELRIDYPHGGRIQLFGADNPDSLRGIYLDGVVIDEVAQCPATLYGEVIRPLLADREGWTIFIGTPKGHDHFYDLYHHALENSDGDWMAKMFKAGETGIIATTELESAKKDMALNQYLQEFECDFNISSAFILIPIERIEEAHRRFRDIQSGLGVTQSPPTPLTSQRIMGMDVGMSLTGDSSAYVIRQGESVLHADEIHLDNTFNIAGWFKDKFQEYQCHRGYIDSIGYGAGVAHTLKAWSLPITEVNSGTTADNTDQFSNTKAELWWRAKDYFAADTALLPDTDIFRKLGHELSTPSYDYTMAGKIKIESKKDLLKDGIASPNLADAFCLTFASSGFFGDVL